MSIVRAATALFVVGVLATGPAGSSSAGTGAPRATSADPVVTFLRPSDGVTTGRIIPYGAIRVRAYDPDVGMRNGDGIQHVRVTVRDTGTRKIVRRTIERWNPYDFGFVLKNGRYIVRARAKSGSGAGGTASVDKIVLTVERGRASLSRPKSVVRREKAAAASLAALNRTRAATGAPPVSLAFSTSDFAYRWSQEMARSGFRHSRAGHAENIAWHSDRGLTARQAANRFDSMWTDSSGHYVNMTNTRHTEVGIGLYRTGSGWWATHVFD